MIFTETITLYHHEDGYWTRTVIDGVQVKPRSERQIDTRGVLQIVSYVSVTIPYTGREYEFSLDDLDIIIPGECREEMNEDNFRELADRGWTVKSVSDNTRRDHLKHWKVIAV